MAKYLVKANDDVLSHCRCTAPLASGPHQLDCPWCGCGWLFSCMQCRKAFAFARVIEVGLSYAEIVRLDNEMRGYEHIEEADADEARWLASDMEPLKLGDIVAYFDGELVPIYRKPVAFRGVFAEHDLAELPHAIAIREPSFLRSVLGDPSYWFERECSDQGG